MSKSIRGGTHKVSNPGTKVGRGTSAAKLKGGSAPRFTARQENRGLPSRGSGVKGVNQAFGKNRKYTPRSNPRVGD